MLNTLLEYVLQQQAGKIPHMQLHCSWVHSRHSSCLQGFEAGTVYHHPLQSQHCTAVSISPMNECACLHVLWDALIKINGNHSHMNLGVH